MASLSPEIDTVIFDLDGTLRVNRPDAQVFFLDRAVALGAPGDADTLRLARQWAHRYWASSECLADDLKTFAERENEFWVNYARRQLEAMKLEDGQAEAWALELHTYMEEQYDWEDTIPEDVVPTLQSLKAAGYQVGLLTNRTKPVDDYLAELGLAPHLDFWVVSGLAGASKPDPEIFNYTLEVARSVPAKTVYIGDNYYADVVGAKRAEIQPVLIDPDEVFPEADCPVIRTIGELPGLLVEPSPN